MRYAKRGFIYFIACEPLEAVKIGFTQGDPPVRLRALQTGCPSPLKLLDYVPGTEDEEQRLHRAFAPLSIQGEWFRHELKLQDFLYYLDHEPGIAATREAFENAICDVLTSTGFHPNNSGPAYEASATVEPFRDMVGEAR